MVKPLLSHGICYDRGPVWTPISLFILIFFRREEIRFFCVCSSNGGVSSSSVAVGVTVCIGAGLVFGGGVTRVLALLVLIFFCMWLALRYNFGAAVGGCTCDHAFFYLLFIFLFSLVSCKRRGFRQEVDVVLKLDLEPSTGLDYCWGFAVHPQWHSSFCVCCKIAGNLGCVGFNSYSIS